jgi:Raf kinase inhibitor-like YbhB/YbcL family protein
MSSGYFFQRVLWLLMVVSVLFCFVFTCADDDDDNDTSPTATPTMQPTATPTQPSSFSISSSAFEEGDPIPVQYTCDGEDISPDLHWTESPANSQSFVVLMYDPDAPNGTFHHWGVYDIPPERTELPEDIPRGDQFESFYQARNDFGYSGYGGPCPPANHGPHHYYFRLLALDVATLGLEAGATYDAVAAASEGHIIDETSLMGTYDR